MSLKKILVVDDSAFMRKIITEQINKISGFEVVATAHDGEASLWKIERFKPDAITLDVEMPGMNGLETLKKIREKWDIPVFMLSSVQEQDITIAALEAGAIDFIEKPKNLRERPREFQEELTQHLEAVFKTRSRKVRDKQSNEPLTQTNSIPRVKKEAVVIGASTGGPKALIEIIECLPQDLSLPIFIVQHMPKGFTTSFAKRLNNHTKRPVVEAKNGEPIIPGTIYLAPGDYHMVIDGKFIRLTQGPKVQRMRPAVDVLFESAVKRYGSNLLAVVLTGMGSDGTEGMQMVKDVGGHTIAQNEESCVVYGMPGNAVAAGVVDMSADLKTIGEIINEVEQVNK